MTQVNDKFVLVCACGSSFLAPAQREATVQFPDGRVEEFCSPSCTHCRATKSAANDAWNSFRAEKAAAVTRFADGQLARQNAAAAAARKPIAGSSEALKARAICEAKRRAHQDERKTGQPKGQSGSKGAQIGGGQSRKAQQRDHKVARRA